MKNSRENKDIKTLIHAYELGLLSKKQEKEFEILIIEDPTFRRDLKDFRKVADLLNSDPQIIDNIAGLSAQSKRRFNKQKSVVFRLMKPSIAITCILILIFIFKPWRIDIKPDNPAVTAENRIVVFQFENKVEPKDSHGLGLILGNLLITDLSESHYIHVDPNLQTENILQQAGSQFSSLFDSGFVKYAAKKLRAKAFITGTIERIEPSLRINIKLIDIFKSDSIIESSFEGTKRESLYDVIDRLTVWVKNELRLPTGAYHEFDPAIEEITSNSQTAYRFYLEGIKYHSKLYWENAKNSFMLALEYDSTMAMAYYYLSFLIDTKYISQAMQYIDYVSRRERLYISARVEEINGDTEAALAILRDLATSFPDEKYTFYRIGELLYTRNEFSTAIAYMDSTLLLDSTYKLAYNILAYSYSELGNIEKSIEAIDAYIRLAPDEANPFDTRGDIYLNHGMVIEAIESYKQAVLTEPIFYISDTKLGHALFFLGEIDSARVYYQKANQAPNYNIRTEARLNLACLPIVNGRFDRAISMLDDFITADKVEMGEENYPTYRVIKSQILFLLNRYDEALNEIQQSVNICEKSFPNLTGHFNSFYAEMLTKCGKIEEAEEIVRLIDEIIAKKGQPKQSLWYALGAITSAKGNYDSAIINYRKSLSNPLYGLTGRFAIGKLYIAQGDYKKAQSTFQDIIKNYHIDYTMWAILIVQAHYYYGFACEHLGQSEPAIVAYRKFLDLWGDSGHQLIIIEDTRRRLTNL